MKKDRLGSILIISSCRQFMILSFCTYILKYNAKGINVRCFGGTKLLLDTKGPVNEFVHRWGLPGPPHQGLAGRGGATEGWLASPTPDLAGWPAAVRVMC